MHISRKIFSRKVSHRIAILLLIAAVTPAMLMTFLSSQKITQFVSNYEHKILLEESRSYALSTFSNLINAQNIIQYAIADKEFPLNLTKKSAYIASEKHQIFNTVEEILLSGELANTTGEKHVPLAVLAALKDSNSNKLTLLVLQDKSGVPSINFVIPSNTKQSSKNLYLAELNSTYLWGDKTDYSSNKNLCAYSIGNQSKINLFCSSDDKANISIEKQSPINMANWELFLGGEFNSDPWLFEINRLTPISKNRLKEFVGSKAYISIAILSLLIVALLSLIQIRKTMAPLEELTAGTKKIAAGDYSPIKVSGTSEFSGLADAFNKMSFDIKQQLDTLRSYATIDKEIASKIDVDETISIIMKRVQSLKPNGIFCIARLEGKNAKEMNFNCRVFGHALPQVRLPLPIKEVEAIQRYGKGKTSEILLSSDFAHERLMAELGAINLWVFPIFWQGSLCAFMSVGSKSPFTIGDEVWTEFRELTSRIGIVISSYEKEQKLLSEAQYDTLTSLPNRILLLDRLQLAMEHSDQTKKPMWVVFIDLDRFKDINDSMGHPVGDQLLIEVGNRLSAETRETDTVARFGGDEFVIVLSGDAGENIQLSVLNRMMNAIAKPIHINHHELISSCSIGIAVYPSDGKDADTLIKNADIAMYRAKELGRDNYQFFKQSLNDKAAERMQMISLLRRAVEHNEFTLHYQPKVDLQTKKIVGLEALLRWHTPTLGNVPPDQFIPIAEEAGLITSIGEWVLHTACKQMATWQQSGLGAFLMAVNVSARQLQQVNFVADLKSILVQTGMKASYLELEITESMLMDRSPKVMDALHAVRALGIKISIDDFGTGYSSLSYLHTLPIDTLKIDKTFTDTITLNTAKAPIVDTVISLAKNLGLKVIAEGVETAEQANYLKKQGCDQIQGYYFSKPLPTNDTRSRLVSGKHLQLPELALVKTHL